VLTLDLTPSQSPSFKCEVLNKVRVCPTPAASINNRLSSNNRCPMNRRHFFTSAAALGLASVGNTQEPAPAAPPPHPHRRVKLSISTYSFRNLPDKATLVEKTIEQAVTHGTDAVEIAYDHMQMEKKLPLEDGAKAYCRNLRRLAFRSGVNVAALTYYTNFVSPDPNVREETVKNVIHTLEIADRLGASCLCLNPGRWNTISDFADYVSKRGLEPSIAGHTDDEAYEWSIACLRKCVERATELGISIAIENHWGLSRTPEGLLKILAAFETPFVGALMDTGNFLEDPYEKLTQIAGKTIFVHAKTYCGGGEWFTLDLDYNRIATILSRANYTGYVSLEMEGKEEPLAAVGKSIELLKNTKWSQ